MAFKVGYVASWRLRLIGRLYEQHKGLPNFGKLIDLVLAPQAQDLEESGQSLLAITSIDDSEGNQLDVIGRIVEQQRAGFDDPTYRKILRARIAANRSSGLPGDIYAVFLLLLAPDPVLSIEDVGVACFVLHIDTPITPVEAELGVDFLSDSKAAGVCGILEWQEQPDSETFTFEQAGYLLTALVGGESELDVFDAGDLEPSGTVRLDPGLPAEEDLAYTSIVDGRYLQLSGTVANAHDEHAEVAQIVPPSAGLGWGDSSDPDVGGKFAGAAAA